VHPELLVWTAGCRIALLQRTQFSTCNLDVDGKEFFRRNIFTNASAFPERTIVRDGKYVRAPDFPQIKHRFQLISHSRKKGWRLENFAALA
jgi:hypothetical protein